MKRLALPFATALALTAITATAFADGHADKSIENAINARQAQMTLISHNLGLLGDMAKGTVDYNAATASSAAANLATVAKLDPSLMWPAGSVQGEVDGTRAKATIWTDFDGFAADLGDLIKAADAMSAVAGTDLASLQGAIGPVGKSCGACHEAYRGPRN